MQMISFEVAVLPFCCLLMLTLAPLAFGQCPSDTGEWMLFKDSCYKFHNETDFWYKAEMTCQESNGHLVSIDSDKENRLVARITICRNVWIGNYGTDLKRLSDPSAYEWSDEKTGHEYNRHNFTDNPISVHRPLIHAANLFWHNSFYHEQFPFMCEVPANGEHKTKCPETMKYYQGNCYLLSSFETTFIEANFYCQNHSTQLTSIMSEAELRFINALDLSTDSCQLEKMWLGLIRLEPCFAESMAHRDCWEWTDFSGLYSNLPEWAEGEPSVNGEHQEHQGCALIRGDRLYAVPCSQYHKFACKIPSDALTPGSRVWQQLESPAKPGEASASSTEVPQLQAPENEIPNETISKSNISMPEPDRGLKLHRSRKASVEQEDDFNLNDLLSTGGGGKRQGVSNKDIEDRFSMKNLENILSTKK